MHERGSQSVACDEMRSAIGSVGHAPTEMVLTRQCVPFVVLPCHLMVDTCALMDIRTSQAIDRSRRHDTLQFTYMCHRS